MPKKSKSLSPVTAIKVAVDLGPPALIQGEDQSAYDCLLAQVTSAVQPTDVIEEFWVRDVVDLVGETLRYRRLKTRLIEACMASGLEELLEPLVGFLESPRDLAAAWFRREPEAMARVKDLLSKAGLTNDHVLARTVAAKLDEIERIDRMLAGLESRRHRVLRELNVHRESLAGRLQAA